MAGAESTGEEENLNFKLQIPNKSHKANLKFQI